VIDGSVLAISKAIKIGPTLGEDLTSIDKMEDNEPLSNVEQYICSPAVSIVHLFSSVGLINQS
jgi:hypothetical protein